MTQSHTISVELDGDTYAALDTAAWEAGMSLVAYASKMLIDSVAPKPAPKKTPAKAVK